MNNFNPLLINGVGTLDWKGFMKSGSQDTIRFWNHKTALTKDKTGEKSLKTTKVRLRKEMVIKLTLTLLEPRYMPYLIDESIMIKNQTKITLIQDLRLEDKKTILKISPKLTHSNFSHTTKRTIMIMAKIFKAKELIFTINNQKPESVEIMAIMDRRTFNFPARFIVALVATINQTLLSE